MKADCKVEGEKCFSHVRYRLLRKKEGNRGERKVNARSVTQYPSGAGQ